MRRIQDIHQPYVSVVLPQSVAFGRQIPITLSETANMPANRKTFDQKLN